MQVLEDVPEAYERRPMSLALVMGIAALITAIAYFLTPAIGLVSAGGSSVSLDAIPYLLFLAGTVFLGVYIWGLIGALPGLAVGYLANLVLSIATPSFIALSIACAAGLLAGTIVANIAYVEVFRTVGGSKTLDDVLLVLAPLCGGATGFCVGWISS
jgi:hypothetical protein